MEVPVKLVSFKDFCPKCKHWNKAENEEPCNECLGVGGNKFTCAPVKFEGRVKTSGRSKTRTNR